MVVKTKAQMYDLYQAGEFGNRPQFWPSLAVFREAEPPDPAITYSLRYSGSAGKWFEMGVPVEDFDNVLALWQSQGADPARVTVSESIPPGDLRLNAEVQCGLTGMDISYNLDPNLSCREAMRHPQYASGASAMVLLRSYLDLDSYENLQRLLTEYPDHVVELTVAKHPCGHLSQNTVFWEVRHY